MIHSDEKWEQLPGEKWSARWGVLCGKEEYHKRCWRSAEWKGRPSSLSWAAPKEEGLRSAEWNWGALKEGGLRSVECNWGAPKEGELRSAEQNRGEPIHAEEHQWDWGVLCQRRSAEKGWVRRVECIIGAPAGIEELPPRAQERGKGGV